MKNNFSYIENKDDTSRKIMLDEESRWGYKTIFPLEYNKNYIELVNNIVDMKSVLEIMKTSKKPTNIKKIRSVETIWKNLGLDLTNIRIINENSTIDFDRLGNFSLREIKKESTVKNPFEIPIYFPICFNKGEVGVFGELICYGVADLSSKTITSLYKGCILEKIGTEHASCVFAHEITHTQLLQGFQVTYDYFNSEFLPILVELLIAGEQSYDSFSHVYNYRLGTLAKNLIALYECDYINFADHCEYDKYNVSTLAALKLSKIFYFANSEEKARIIQMINNIFCGKNLIEDLVQTYDLTLPAMERNLCDVTRIRN